MNSETVWGIVIAILSSSGITTIINVVVNHYGTKDKRSKALMSLLRADILRAYKEYTRQGYCPADEKFVLQEEYNSYHGLGGNDVATKWYSGVIDLPEFYVSKFDGGEVSGKAL